MRLLLILLLYISTLGWSWGDSLASKNKEGNRLYKEGKIEEALSKWRDAQIENPDSDKLYYNIGNGLHGQKKYEDAFREYEKSLNSKDGRLQQNAYYNMGNTHYRMGKLPEAIEDYKKCLEINPKDEDAKCNIEFIKKKLKEQSKKDEQKKDSQQKENKDQKPEENKEGQEKENQAQKEQQDKREENQESRAQEDKEKSEKEKAEKKPLREEKKDEMSKEDAVRLLDALKDDENDLQKELRTKPVEGGYKVEKDW